MQVIKDFAELPSALSKTTARPTTKKPRKERKYDTVTPFYFRKLLDANLSHAKIGELIGISDGNVSNINTTNVARKSIELAAQLIWERDFEPKNMTKDGMFFVSILIPKEGFSKLKPWLEESELKYNVFK